MNISPIDIAISIGILTIVSLLVFNASRNRRAKALTPLAGIAFGSIITGTLFGDSRLVSYSFVGLGVGLAVIDIVLKARRSDNS